MSTLDTQVVAAFLRTMTHDELADELRIGRASVEMCRRTGDRDAELRDADMCDAIVEEMDRRTHWAGPLPIVEGSRP